MTDSAERHVVERSRFSAVPRSGGLSTSNARYLRGVDHCAPLGDLVIDPGLQLVRTRRPGFVAERTEALDHTWFSKQPREFGIQASHDRIWQISRSHKTHPAAHVKSRESRLRNGRNVR